MAVATRRGVCALAAGLVVVAIGCAWAWRVSFLRWVGGALVVNSGIQASELIVVTADAGVAGAIEAADLVRAGIASRVAVLTAGPSAADRELLRRGVMWESRGLEMMRLLRALGVEKVESMEDESTGSASEAALVPRWCAAHRIRTVVVVTTAEHSRRLRRMLRRAADGQVQIEVRPARFSACCDEGWWQTRAGSRAAVIELQKLLLDLLRHPVPVAMAWR